MLLFCLSILLCILLIIRTYFHKRYYNDEATPFVGDEYKVVLEFYNFFEDNWKTIMKYLRDFQEVFETIRMSNLVRKKNSKQRKTRKMRKVRNSKSRKL